MKRVVASSGGALHKVSVERGGDAVDVERLVAGTAGDVEAAAEVELGKRHADGVGDLAGVGDGRAVDLGQRLGVEALRAGEHVQAAPVDAGFDQALDQRGHALGIDSERARPAADGDPALLDREGRGDPDRELRLDADALGGADRARAPRLRFRR